MTDILGRLNEISAYRRRANIRSKLERELSRRFEKEVRVVAMRKCSEFYFDCELNLEIDGCSIYCTHLEKLVKDYCKRGS
jgi:hypothetical protein